MHYNIDGILYRVYATGGICLILGIVCLILSKNRKQSKRIKVDFIIAVMMIIFAFAYIGSHIYMSINPSILMNEGYFVEVYRDSTAAPPLPFTYKYRFTSSSNKNRVFYLDSFSKKDIYPEDFLEGEKYRIFYEKNTNIILKVEEIS